MREWMAGEFFFPLVCARLCLVTNARETWSTVFENPLGRARENGWPANWRTIRGGRPRVLLNFPSLGGFTNGREIRVISWNLSFVEEKVSFFLKF